MSLPRAVTADGKRADGAETRQRMAKIARALRRYNHELPADKDSQAVKQAGSVGTLEVACALCGCTATITHEGTATGLALAGPCQGEAR
jgi:hypothetical protein